MCCDRPQRDIGEHAAAVHPQAQRGERGVHSGQRIRDGVRAEDGRVRAARRDCEAGGDRGVVTERDAVAGRSITTVAGDRNPGHARSFGDQLLRVDAEL